jgi:hypothetical protein
MPTCKNATVDVKEFREVMKLQGNSKSAVVQIKGLLACTQRPFAHCPYGMYRTSVSSRRREVACRFGTGEALRWTLKSEDVCLNFIPNYLRSTTCVREKLMADRANKIKGSVLHFPAMAVSTVLYDGENTIDNPDFHLFSPHDSGYSNFFGYALCLFPMDPLKDTHSRGDVHLPRFLMTRNTDGTDRFIVIWDSIIQEVCTDSDKYKRRRSRTTNRRKCDFVLDFRVLSFNKGWRIA